MRALVVVAASAIVAAAAACQPEQGAPQIVLQLPDGTECNEDSVDCAFDFGVVTDADAGAEVTMKLKNVGDGDGTVTDVELLGDPGFTLVAKPADIAAASAADITFKASVVTVRSTTDVNIAWEAPETVIHLKLQSGSDSAPHIGIDPPACDFGAVAQGEEAQCTITVLSTGSADLVVDAAEIVDGEDVFSAVLPTVTTLPAGQSSTMTVFAHPNGAGAAQGLLRIGSNDPVNGGSTFVTLTVASPPHLVLPDAGCDFGDVVTGDLTTCDVVIGNDGVADLVLTNIGVTGDLNGLGLTEAPPDQLVIGANETATITTATAPPDVGELNGALEFDTNDPDNPHGSVPLHANGVAP